MAAVLTAAPAFAGNSDNEVKAEVKLADTQFSVKVNSGTKPVVGATVKLFQNGTEIGSAVTNDRGIAALTVPNQEAVTIKVMAKGYTPLAKENFIPAMNEIVPVSLKTFKLKPNPKVKK